MSGMTKAEVEHFLLISHDMTDRPSFIDYLCMYDLAREELRLRPQRLSLGSETRKQLVTQREHWDQPTTVSRLADDLWIQDTKLWLVLRDRPDLRMEWIDIALNDDSLARHKFIESYSSLAQ